MGIRLKNKGQIFLIMAAIVVTVLIILKISVNIPSIIQRKRELEGRFEQRFFSNIVNELVKVIEISYYQPSNITKNVFNFGNFTRKKMTGRMLNFEFLYVGSITPKTGTRMNITVINLLNKPINATLQLNDTEEEKVPTFAVNSSQDVTSEVNSSDDIYAYESCSGTGACQSPYIYVNFTTSSTFENVTIEGYYTYGTEGSDNGANLICHDGTDWIFLGTLGISEINKTFSLTPCSNSDGNYSFRVYCYEQGIVGSVVCGLWVDYIWINKTTNVKSSEMVDYSSWDTNFTITQGEGYILTISYNDTYEEYVTIETKINKSMYIGFFDINLIGSETTYKDKFQKSYTLP